MKTVVIDAGHGGKDPGNLGTGRYKAREKDISLDVALRVGGYIKKEFSQIKVIYTRSTDVFIGLNERADIANKAKADLFISIHCNAFTKLSSHGVETYALGLHRNKENLQVAMKENSSITMEDDYKTKYEGFDPNSAESIIALTIMQSAFLQQSLSLSSYIQKQFRERVGRTDRGVKQAGFLVLRKTTMPSVLVELGFLTNEEEEDFLNSENGKAYMSSAIFRGFKEYKEGVEDPFPEGYVSPEQKREAEEKRKADRKKAKTDSLTKVWQQAVAKARADSVQRAKEKHLEQETLQKEILAQETAKKELAKAEADSLALHKQQLLEEKERTLTAAEKAQADSLEKANQQAVVLAAADSAQQVKQHLLEEERKRKEELENQETAENERLKAKYDSLELRRIQLILKKQVIEAAAETAKSETEKQEQAQLKLKADSLQLKKQTLLEAKKKREDELAQERKNEQEAAAQKALAEKKRLKEVEETQKAATQSKEDAKEWLQEIKAVKEEELADAKKKAEIDTQKTPLQDTVTQKEPVPTEVKKAEEDSEQKLQQDSLIAQREQQKKQEIEIEKRQLALTDSIEKVREQAAKTAANARQDSLTLAVAAEKQQIKALEIIAKAKEDSIAAALKAKKEAITIDTKKAVTPEEAELLFLQLRKRQLEQRIAELTSKKVRVRKVVDVQQPEKIIEAPIIIGSGTDASMSGIILHVQILTSAEPLDKKSQKFKGQNVKQYLQGGLYKYTVGNSTDFEEITKLQGELRNLGFKGAFVVAFLNGKRIKVAEARKNLTE